MKKSHVSISSRSPESKRRDESDRSEEQDLCLMNQRKRHVDLNQKIRQINICSNLCINRAYSCCIKRNTSLSEIARFVNVAYVHETSDERSDVEMQQWDQISESCRRDASRSDQDNAD